MNHTPFHAPAHVWPEMNAALIDGKWIRVAREIRCVTSAATILEGEGHVRK